MLELRTVRLTQDYKIKPFDCNDSDLNEFLLQDAKDYLKQLMAVTYLIESNEETVAFFSVCNDKIKLDEDHKGTWRRIKKRFPHRKHRSEYPSVKIGRLGVSAKFQKQGYGMAVLDTIKEKFASDENKTGCRFLTVDAYAAAIGFYLKNGFEYFFPEEDKKKEGGKSDDTALMFFDLILLRDNSNEPLNTKSESDERTS